MKNTLKELEKDLQRLSMPLIEIKLNGLLSYEAIKNIVDEYILKFPTGFTVDSQVQLPKCIDYVSLIP